MAGLYDAEPVIGSLKFWMLGIRQVVDTGGIDWRGEPTTYPIQEAGFGEAINPEHCSGAVIATNITALVGLNHHKNILRPQPVGAIDWREHAENEIGAEVVVVVVGVVAVNVFVGVVGEPSEPPQQSGFVIAGPMVVEVLRQVIWQIKCIA